MGNKLLLAFSVTPEDPISRVIAWATRGQWSHVALVRGGFVIESSGVGQPKGVRMVSLKEWRIRYPHMEIRVVHHPTPDRVWDIACDHLGAGYDWSWLFGWLLNRPIGDREKWTCAELIVHSAAKAGHRIIPMSQDLVTPRDLYLVTQECCNRT